MGNEVASTINWSELAKSAQKCDVDTAKDIMIRLNIDFPDSENKDNDNNDNDDNDKKDDGYNNDLEKFLDDYLDKLSDDDLKKLFLVFGVNPDFDEKTNKKTKISVLMLIASKEYWRKNWNLHPQQKRLKNWIFVHEKYRSLVAEIVKTSSTDLDAARNLLIKFEKKLNGHSEFEDNMLFKFMEENLDKTIHVIKQQILPKLHDEHQEHKKIKEKLMKCKDLVEFQALIKEYQISMLQHMQKEEENLIHIWLNLNKEEYSKYREYLSYKYAVVY